jgi:hypothetical protein
VYGTISKNKSCTVMYMHAGLLRTHNRGYDSGYVTLDNQRVLVSHPRTQAPEYSHGPGEHPAWAAPTVLWREITGPIIITTARPHPGTRGSQQSQMIPNTPLDTFN